MTLTLPEEKSEKVISLCKKSMCKRTLSVQSASELIGYLVSVCPAVPYGQLFTRQLEMEKSRELNISGHYEARFKLSDEALLDLQWWIDNVHTSKRKIVQDSYDCRLVTDSSLTGWGGWSGSQSTRGFWSLDEQGLHINVLELKAIYNSLRSFEFPIGYRILLRCDNTAAIAYINNFGGVHSEECHKIAKQIWMLCITNSWYIFASYISSTDNYEADGLSRLEVDQSDFSLNSDAYATICREFGPPILDCFATHRTRKCQYFYSWFPDPESSGVDAFTLPWKEHFYAFPPFNLVSRTLRKIMQEDSRGIVVVPFWDTQPWFPLFLKLCQSKFIVFEPSSDLLISPYTCSPHPLWKTLRLAAGFVSATLTT